MPFGDEPVNKLPEISKLENNEASLEEFDKEIENTVHEHSKAFHAAYETRKSKKVELTLDDQIHAAVYWLDTHTRAQIASPISDEHKRMERYVIFLKANKFEYQLKPPAPSAIKKQKIADSAQKKLI